MFLTGLQIVTNGITLGKALEIINNPELKQELVQASNIAKETNFILDYAPLIKNQEQKIKICKFAINVRNAYESGKIKYEEAMAKLIDSLKYILSDDTKKALKEEKISQKDISFQLRSALNKATQRMKENPKEALTNWGMNMLKELKSKGKLKI